MLLLGPFAVAVGALALRRVRTRGTRGRRLAVTALVVGAVETLLAAVAVVVLAVTLAGLRDLPTALDGPRDAHPAQVVPGHCLAGLPPDGAVRRVQLVPCDEPHAAEAVSTYAFAPGAAWPGQAEAARAVAASCRLGDADRAAGRTAVAWAPTRAAWLLADRTGLCLLTG
ncbi:hypothetical protein Cma02nite_07140 [Cellulomonas marina]|uniref:Septum formation n=1 Tax=Cellulomonas marina TaxID=988821 RepID=A0A1I0YZE1_9CELL|nr:hypothetical protein Cma02nite_07140 [Cellulomonas marina]SFB18417.1 Septum formation [Cellulomonas marina]